MLAFIPVLYPLITNVHYIALVSILYSV